MASNSKVVVTLEGQHVRTQHLKSTFLREVNVDIIHDGKSVVVKGWWNKILYRLLNKRCVEVTDNWFVHVSEKKW